MSNNVYVLVDCNNFFVSCERIFRPDLEGKPVVVLSSNDGCVVARSNEAKLAGIPMGAPAFKYKQIFDQQKVLKFSANFELYGDISKRITALLTTITPRIEIYSVDESFLDISELQISDYREWGRIVRESIYRHVGVPVSLGIATSKTLAKLGAEVAKQNPAYQGSFSFIDILDSDREAVLANIPVKDVWGVGRKFSPKIRAEGVSNALALARMRPQHAQQLMGIHGRQMVAELNGTPCYTLTAEHAPAKSIMRSRTFGEDTNQAHVIEAAIASLGARAAFHLRSQHLLAQRIGIFTNTSRHKPGYRQWYREIRLPMPTNDSGQIISLLVKELATFYSDKQQYHQLGVFLHNFVPEGALQTDLLGSVNPENHDKAKARMEALDSINTRWGKGKIYYAAEDLSTSWQPRQKIRSPRYVSKWNELPEAHVIQY